MASPIIAKERLWLNGLMGEEQPESMAGLLLTLVLLLHIGVFYIIKSAAPEPITIPIKIMEVSMVAEPLPVADVAPPAPTPPPPPPKPVPPKPKPVVKPKPVLKPKPVIAKTEPIYIPVDADPKPVVNPAPPAPPQPKAAPAPSPQPAKQTFTEARADAGYGYNPKPKYPNVARSRGWEGKVVLQVHVSADGESESVTVSQSSGHDILDEAAVSAVEGWRFKPAKRGDTAVASTVSVPINFKLD
ncbi:MAG: energy transducer TonB [Methylococcales bacterium]|nr:energy transducer TonB [Methylococcales bacterium]